MKLFEVTDPIGNRIVLTRERWNHAWRHDIPGIDALTQCIQRPGEIRRSPDDADVLLYYSSVDNHYLCIVVQGETGFIMTAYDTSTMKEGETIWKKS